VLRGRGLEWRDGPDAPAVAVVNESWIAGTPRTAIRWDGASGSAT